MYDATFTLPYELTPFLNYSLLNVELNLLSTEKNTQNTTDRLDSLKGDDTRIEKL